jgi:NADPH:quinone reductase and related Zn-dependent oxidoreductases
MKTVVIQKFGGPEGLVIVEVSNPSPSHGEVLIAIEAISVGYQDAMIRSGALNSLGFREGHILGGEVAGRVTAVGDGVDPIWIGRRVWAFSGSGGGYAEMTVAHEKAIIEIPDALSCVQAVALGSNGIVAHYALRHAHFTHGESLLIRGAAGPIGIMLVQLAARKGASAIAVTTSSEVRGNRLLELGGTHILDRTGAGGPNSPESYDVIIDIVGGTDMPEFFKKLKPNGRMVMVGAVGGFPPDDFAKTMLSTFQKSLTFSTFSANTVSELNRRETAVHLFELASKGELEIMIHEVLPLDQAVLAHQKLERSEAFGRLLLSPIVSQSL